MMMFPDFNDPAYSEQGHYTDFPEYGKQCDLIEPWRGYRRGTIVAQAPKGFVVQLSSGAEIDVYPDEIEID